MPPRPSPDQLRLAAEWLGVNDGVNAPHLPAVAEEYAACQATAAWLRAQADKADAAAAETKAVQDYAKENSRPIAEVRAALRRYKKMKSEKP